MTIGCGREVYIMRTDGTVRQNVFLLVLLIMRYEALNSFSHFPLPNHTQKTSVSVRRRKWMRLGNMPPGSCRYSLRASFGATLLWYCLHNFFKCPIFSLRKKFRHRLPFIIINIISIITSFASRR